MAIYKVIEHYTDDDGETGSTEFLMSVDLAQAASPVMTACDEDPDRWSSTPHQCASGCHDAIACGRLASDYHADCAGVPYADRVEVIEL